MRLSKDAYFMELAKTASNQTTCLRKNVGCVLVDARGCALGIGYNGIASGLPHCNEAHSAWGAKQPLKHGVFLNACIGHDLPPGQDSCEAIHAEVNALLQCRAVQEIDTAYVTLSPCKSCVKLLLNTPCRRIVFLEEHTLTEARDLWVMRAKREWVYAPKGKYLDNLRKELSP